MKIEVSKAKFMFLHYEPNGIQMVEHQPENKWKILQKAKRNILNSFVI